MRSFISPNRAAQPAQQKSSTQMFSRQQQSSAQNHGSKDQAAGVGQQVNASVPAANGRSAFAVNFAQIPVFHRPVQGLQAKLVVNAPGDAFEQEADRAAEQVMRMASPPAGAPASNGSNGASAAAIGVQRACACGGSCDDCKKKEEGEGHKPLQMKAAGPVNAGGMEAPPIVHDVLQSSGQPLDAGTRAFMEPQFGHDFSRVRVHTDAKAAESARAVGARAYTVGSNVVFGDGEFAPGSRAGQRLLGHELTHVVQQRNALSGVLHRDPEPAGKDNLDQILNDQELQDIFGKGLLEQLAKEIRANPKSAAFVRENSSLGVLALADTRDPKGLDPDKAKAALNADSKHKLYNTKLLKSRKDAPKTFWFQQQPTQESAEDPADSDLRSTAHLKDVVDDPAGPVQIPAPVMDGKPAGPEIWASFAFMGSDLRGSKGSDEIESGKTRIINALRKVSGDITSVAPVPAGTAKEQDRQKTQDEQTRARLKEVLSGYRNNKPLRIFLASGEEQKVLGPSPRTEAIFVHKEDIGNDKKLEAAIRIPLVAFLGSNQLSADNAAEAVLHEMVHALLIRRGLAANNIWEKIKSKAVQGPATVKNRYEEMAHLFLLAQEEVFVYENVSMLGSEYSQLAKQIQPKYDDWISKAKTFFKDRKIGLSKLPNKLDVTEKVKGKKVSWEIAFDIPDPTTVSGTDLTPLNDLTGRYPR